MQPLNLPSYSFNIKKKDDAYLIFDQWRKKYVALTPEEWVRQHFLQFLVDEKQFPVGLIAVEKTLLVNGMNKRCDAIVYDYKAMPLVIIEFKAPNISLSQTVFDQVAVYNSKLKVDYFMISNGLEHYACKVNTKSANYSFFQEIPSYQNLL